jgi:cbb3-type cytochrome oxidase maturation protein
LESLFLLIPLAILIAFIIAALFFWSVKSGQFDDMQGPAHSILMDDDSPDFTAQSDETPDTSEEKEDNHGNL